MTPNVVGSFVLAFIATSNLGCEIDTRLNVTGNNPPQFRMTGSGQLTSIRVVGPHKQQEVEGEDQYMYWMIQCKDEDSTRNVGRISPVVYGVVPDGYVQVYPAHGQAQPLVEGEIYFIQVINNNANGDQGCFTIKNGLVKFAKYKYLLTEN